MITFKQMLSTRGRINRWTFFLSVFSLMSVCVILFSGFFAARDSGMGVILKTILTLVFYAGIIFACYIHIMMAVKRLHDLDLSGWWILLIIFIPIFPYAVAYSDLWRNDESVMWFQLCMALTVIQFFFIFVLLVAPGRKFYNYNSLLFGGDCSKRPLDRANYIRSTTNFEYLANRHS